ncbi:translation initiation factor eIF 4e-like domain-containing protein [Desarmillaria tabescens]|uniref:Translation initiation factor eIF 4e-like domain-containing protein n=1 Tax=Armillaria tabescens TaxID=1929756 RepID=A0AA39KHW7_ARMTA|nr:translation initiation factor eIF 4e-like domain-containing protein [Desarmillaria tabescens]KAK0460164.1 translation initiation factor eIF 4e-like domain-containing protein [Desarmillaria tabescens]
MEGLYDPTLELVQAINNMHIMDPDTVGDSSNINGPNIFSYTAPNFSAPLSGWVAAPTPSDGYNGHIVKDFNEETSTDENIHQYCSRWPPHRTPVTYCNWISVNRDTVPKAAQENQVDALKSSFQALLARGNKFITVDSLDQIACESNVVSGKWLIFSDSRGLGEFWEDVVRLVCLFRRKGCAKVSPNKGHDRYVICIYADDYTDLEDVNALRDGLRRIGVTWKIGFKMDAYTHLGIYGKNAWGIRPNRYWQ